MLTSPTSQDLELLDMPDCILQHISTFVPSRQWAKDAAHTCRRLNALPLPVLEVCSRFIQLVSHSANNSTVSLETRTCKYLRSSILP